MSDGKPMIRKPDDPETLSHSKGPGTVLVVDDSEVVRMMISHTLRIDRYRVLEASDGIRGMESALRYRPDVVISDIIMPEMDGLELCRRIRSNTWTRDIFFIILTALEDREARVQGLAAGCDEYLQKPVMPYELRLRLRNAMRLKKVQRDLNERNERLYKALKRLREQREEIELAIEEARRTYVNLMPRSVEQWGGFTIEFMVEASERAAGDHIDVLDLGNSKKGLILADVSGHGIPAAFVTGMVHARLHAQWDADMDIATFLKQLNAYLYAHTLPETYLTLFIGILDTRSGDLDYVLAAHPEPVLCRKEGGIQFLPESTTHALGIFPEISCDISSLKIERGDALYVYSDGLSEGFSMPGKAGVSMDRLVMEHYLEHPGAGLRWFLDRLVRHNRGRSPDDDLSILLIRREGQGDEMQSDGSR
ncbi:MAG: fused response regulator/phosphatase [Deltaproteobacteria bacterium]|nr:fused response regulator/phosphatase [Deltaproteobacteria bacterium]